MRTPLELLESRHNSMLDKYELIMVSKYGNGNINSLLCVKDFNSEKKQVLDKIKKMMDKYKETIKILKEIDCIY